LRSAESVPVAATKKPRIMRGLQITFGVRHQAMMLTRVPCPGGNGGCAGGVAVLESSWVFTSGGLVWTGCGGGNGGGVVTLEILIETILFWI
jgi:hypothetical protein